MHVIISVDLKQINYCRYRFECIKKDFNFFCGPPTLIIRWLFQALKKHAPLFSKTSFGSPIPLAEKTDNDIIKTWLRKRFHPIFDQIGQKIALHFFENYFRLLCAKTEHFEIKKLHTVKNLVSGFMPDFVGY